MGLTTPFNVSQFQSVLAVFGTVFIRQHGPLLQHDSKIVIYRRSVRLLGMKNKQTDHSHHLLHGRMRVIEKVPF